MYMGCTVGVIVGMHSNLPALNLKAPASKQRCFVVRRPDGAALELSVMYASVVKILKRTFQPIVDCHSIWNSLYNVTHFLPRPSRNIW